MPDRHQTQQQLWVISRNKDTNWISRLDVSL